VAVLTQGLLGGEECSTFLIRLQPVYFFSSIVCSVLQLAQRHMAIVIYTFGGISILLAVGGLAAYAQTKHLELLLSSIVSIGFSLLAIALVHWWPLVVGFSLNWSLRLLGLDPDYKSR
jgi:hypothetical protein